MQYCDDCARRIMACGMPNILSEVKHKGTCELCGREKMMLQGRHSDQADWYQYDGPEPERHEWSDAEREIRAKSRASKEREKASRRPWKDDKSAQLTIKVVKFAL